MDDRLWAGALPGPIGPELDVAAPPSRTASTPVASRAPQAHGDRAHREAYRRRAAAIAAVEKRELVAINLDVGAAALLAQGRLAALARHRDAILALPGIDHALIEGIEDLVLATRYLDARCATVGDDPSDLAAAYAEGLALRRMLLKDLRSLVQHGRIPGDRLAGLRGRTGFASVAADLAALAVLVRTSWPDIRGRTPIEPLQVARAAWLGNHIAELAVGRRDVGPERAQLMALRARAFTLLLRAWDEARCALAFLRRREGDVEAIAPSLFLVRHRGKRRQVQGATPGSSPRPTPPTRPSAAAPTGGAARQPPRTSPTSSSPSPTSPERAGGSDGGRDLAPREPQRSSVGASRVRESDDADLDDMARELDSEEAAFEREEEARVARADEQGDPW